MSPRSAQDAPLWQSLGTIGAFTAALLTGPTIALILNSWWPVLGGFMVMVAWFVFIITINLVREHQREPTVGELIMDQMLDGPPSAAVLRQLLADAEEREAEERRQRMA